jgi:hypothetical protein
LKTTTSWGYNSSKIASDIIGKALGVLDSKGEMSESFHGPIFQSSARLLFGHTNWQHDLVTPHERALTLHSITVGSTIEFNIDGETFVGKVNRIQKRVTVLVRSAKGQSGAREFSDGNFYRKFYVPMHLCKAVDS